MSLQVENRPVVEDCPVLHYTGPREDVRLLYRKCVGVNDWVEVIGDPDGGGYEWVIEAQPRLRLRARDAGIERGEIEREEA